METVVTPANTNKYPSSITRAAAAAMKQINKDLSHHIVIKELAKNVGANECTLKKVFKDIFNITVYRYLLKSRMQYAYRLLQVTNYKEKKIAALYGYKSLPGFITTFRKYFDISPREWRKKFN